MRSFLQSFLHRHPLSLVCFLAFTTGAALAFAGGAPPPPQALAAVPPPSSAWWIALLLTLAPVLVASLITRLTPYPRARGVVAALQVVGDVLSFLQHRDSPGVVQLPLVQRSTPPPELGPQRDAGSTSAVALLAVFVGAALLLAGCGTFLDSFKQTVAGSASAVEVASQQLRAQARVRAAAITADASARGDRAGGEKALADLQRQVSAAQVAISIAKGVVVEGQALEVALEAGTASKDAIGPWASLVGTTLAEVRKAVAALSVSGGGR